MLAGARPAARMVRDLDQRQMSNAEKLRLRARQLHEDRLAERHRRLSLFLQFDGVVDTPRRARPSSAQAGDHRVAPVDDLLHHRFRRALHMGWLGSK
jgi:hypothetical protein